MDTETNAAGLDRLVSAAEGDGQPAWIQRTSEAPASGSDTYGPLARLC